MVTLETNRLLLREFRIEDATDVFAFTKLSQVGNSAGWPPHKTIKDAKNRILSLIDKQEVFAIELKEEQKVIGSIGVQYTSFHSQMRKANKRQVGFSIHPDYWGKGYATEALLQVIDHLFTASQVDRIYCSFIKGNAASKRVMEKCGLEFYKEKETKLDFLGNKTLILQEYKLTKEMHLKRIKE